MGLLVSGRVRVVKVIFLFDPLFYFLVIAIVMPQEIFSRPETDESEQAQGFPPTNLCFGAEDALRFGNQLPRATKNIDFTKCSCGEVFFDLLKLL